MIELETEITISCDRTAYGFRVYVIKNAVKVDITDTLSDHELKTLQHRYDEKKYVESVYD